MSEKKKYNLYKIFNKYHVDIDSDFTLIYNEKNKDCMEDHIINVKSNLVKIKDLKKVIKILQDFGYLEK